MKNLLCIRLRVDLALDTDTQQQNVLSHMKGGDANSHLADISVIYLHLTYTIYTTRMKGKTTNMKTNLTLTTMTNIASHVLYPLAYNEGRFLLL